MKKVAPALALCLGALLHLPAHAWFFFWIPTGQIRAAIEGNHCVGESAKEGDRITAQGRDWIVKSTSGTSSRCSGTPQWPVIAKLEPILSDEELQQVHTICAAQGVHPGSRATIPGLGEVEVRSLSPAGCTDMRAPVSANVVRLQSEFVQAALRRLPSRAPAPAPVPAQPTYQADTACVPMGAGPGDRIAIKERGEVMVMSIMHADEHCPSDRPWMARVQTLPGSSIPAPGPQTVTVQPPVSGSQPTPASQSVVERLRELRQLHDEKLITDSVYEQQQKEILRSQ